MTKREQSQNKTYIDEREESTRKWKWTNESKKELDGETTVWQEKKNSMLIIGVF